jgi:hypothetical protein
MPVIGITGGKAFPPPEPRRAAPSAADLDQRLICR